MDGWENHHRVVVVHAVHSGTFLAGIHVGNLLIHVEEVAITLANHVDAEALDGLREVEEHSQAGVIHTKTLVATLLGST